MNYLVEILLLISGLACELAVKLIGSSIDQNGFLHEPFALIPIGFILIFAATLSLAARKSWQCYKKVCCVKSKTS